MQAMIGAALPVSVVATARIGTLAAFG